MSITLEGVAMRTFRFAAILLSILAASVRPAVPAAHAQSAVGVTADTIKIGTFGALTGPGYLYGKIIMNGAETVYNEVNKAGGIHGRKIVLVREDDRCDAAAATAAAAATPPSPPGPRSRRAICRSSCSPPSPTR